MFRPRCHLPTPGQPGSLYLVTLLLRHNCARFRPECMTQALDKWQRLFTVRVILWHLCDLGAVLLVYVPNRLLGEEEARSRNADFDAWLLSRRKDAKGKRPRAHSFSAEQLGSLSEFMRLFCPELTGIHRKLAPPEDLPPGYSRIPAYRRRYGSVAVQHDALPPAFSPEQLAVIRKALLALGFHGGAGPCPKGSLRMSRHGVGTHGFLADLELRCQRHLRERGKAPRLWRRHWRKYIAPVSEEALARRIGELQTREAHEGYPKTWSLLAGLDALTDKLTNPAVFAPDVLMPTYQKQGMMAFFAPLTVTLMLTDGLLRWYYRERKGVEFPHYDFYRELLPWEIPK